MTVVLASAGCAIFVLLGLAHTAITLQSSPTGGPMMPTDPDVRSAMSIRGGLGFAPDIDSNLYRAWIGFNLSHSLGLIAIGGVLLVHIATDFADASTTPWFVVAAIAAPLIYFVLAQLYWFDKPRDATALAALLLWAGLIIEWWV